MTCFFIRHYMTPPSIGYFVDRFLSNLGGQPEDRLSQQVSQIVPIHNSSINYLLTIENMTCFIDINYLNQSATL